MTSRGGKYDEKSNKDVINYGAMQHYFTGDLV